MFINPFKKMDINRAKRSSHVLKQSTEQTQVINTRLKVCIVVIALLFLVIAGRLFSLQVLHQKEYDEKMTAYTTKKQTIASPRGAIYDRDGKVLVQSVSNFTISYYPLENNTEEMEWEMAKQLVDDLDLKADNITERQMKDMYMRYESQMEGNDLSSLLSEKQREKIANGEASEKEIEEWKLEKIDIADFDEQTKAMYQVKMNMDAGNDNQYKTVVENATNEQLSFVSENSSKYPGFKATFDWKRETSEEGESVQDILGRISTQTQGIPSEESDYYLSLDYSMNDRVGISGLEEQYENYLSGSKSVYNIKFDENGAAYLEEVSAGKSGYDLTLTLDIDFQKRCDEILHKALQNGQSNPLRSHFKDIYLVAMNPKTGEVLAMSGMTKGDDGKIYSNPTGTYLNASQVGSAVKVATLYMGLNEGVVSSGEIINDAPMNIKGTQTISSFQNYGLINGIDAIAVSSNVYMWNIVIRLGGSNYVSGQPLGIMDAPATFQLMRSYYNMFGLGVKTGIDLPNEQIGSIGMDSEAGTLLYYGIGQYDTYTTMQLAQYAATIANDGVRVKPHLLKYVSEVNDRNSIVYNEGTTVLGTILGNTKLLADGKEGMKQCITRGKCGPLQASNVGEVMASKTGTAETKFVKDGKVYDSTNATQIAYGPVDDPEIVFACSAPNSNNGVGMNVQENICGVVIAEASKEYFANYR